MAMVMIIVMLKIMVMVKIMMRLEIMASSQKDLLSDYYAELTFDRVGFVDARFHGRWQGELEVDGCKVLIDTTRTQLSKTA